MRPKWTRRVVQIAAGTLGALALNAGAQAAFTTYAASANGATTIATTSTAIDLGSAMTGFNVMATLGLTFSSDSATTLTATGAGLQTVQGCVNAAGSCDGLWVDISGFELGGATFTQTAFPTQVVPFTTGTLSYSGPAIESLRLKFDTAISPPNAVGATGSLTVTTVPESGTWALMLAGIIAAGGIARARRRFLVA
jgi:hypothetical protein